MKICLCPFSCGQNNIYTFHNGSERFNEVNPIWHFEHVKHNKNAKHEHDFIPSVFIFALEACTEPCVVKLRYSAQF